MHPIALRARAVSPPAPFLTEVGPEVWEALLEEAFARLGNRSESVFNAVDSQSLRARWGSAPLSAGALRSYSDNLRREAFSERNSGAAAVETTEEPPGHLAALAAVFDYLATLAGPNGLIFFDEPGPAE